MTRVTMDRLIRRKFQHDDGRLLDAIPRVEKLCAICKTTMMVSENQEARYHKCCRKFRNNEYGAHSHIEKEHGNTR